MIVTLVDIILECFTLLQMYHQVKYIRTSKRSGVFFFSHLIHTHLLSLPPDVTVQQKNHITNRDIA